MEIKVGFLWVIVSGTISMPGQMKHEKEKGERIDPVEFLIENDGRGRLAFARVPFPQVLRERARVGKIGVGPEFLLRN